MGGRVFVDTNVLVFANNVTSVYCTQARKRLSQLLDGGDELWISRQVIREYLAVTSRLNLPRSVATADIVVGLQNLISGFLVADEDEVTTRHLLQLLRDVPSGGKQVHDANVVATMQAYSITQLLTHNLADFARFEPLVQLLAL